MSTLSEPTRSRVVELRQYTVFPGRRDVLVELFEREFIAPQQAAGMAVFGPFHDLDDPDRFVWWRGFVDMAARAPALQAFYGGSVWQAHRDSANATMVDSDDVLLLRPLAGRAPLALAPGDMLLVTVCVLPPGTDAVADGFVATALAAAAIDASVPAIGVHVTETAPNNFPRLPLREGENVLLWCAPFADRAACERHERARAVSPAWRRLLADLPAAPTLLRLAPTSRSCLHL